MADTKMVDMTEDTSPASTDIVYGTKDPGGTPLDRKLTYANVSKVITPEGTNVLSTGEAGGTKFLREDGDGTCSWQTPAGGGNTLDGAYDQGGAGVGKDITADTGNVTFSGAVGGVQDLQSLDLVILDFMIY